MAERPLSLTAPLVRAFQEGRKDVTRSPIRPAPEWKEATRAQGRGWSAQGRSKDLALHAWEDTDSFAAQLVRHIGCPFGVPGDTLWIREPARVVDVARRWGSRILFGGAKGERVVQLRYQSDGVLSDWLPYPERLHPPVVGRGIPNGVHREGARLFAEVVSVGAEPVKDITEEDAKREGIESLTLQAGPDVIVGRPWATEFRRLWTSLYGQDSWDNDWCWRLELRRLERQP